MARAKVRYVPDRQATQDVALRSPALRAQILKAADAVAPADTIVTAIEGKTRTRVTIYDPSPRAIGKEAKTGHLSRALGALRL